MNLKGEFSILLRGEKDRRTPMKSLNEDIKTGNFKPVYLLYGEEAYLKKQYRDRITKAIFPDGDTVNYAYYEGKGINPGELIDLAETMPFFAKRRLIVVENSGFFKNATPDLADYIKTMPDTACFLFVENEADKRGKMYKAVKSKGRVVEMARQDEKTLLYWVAGNVKKEGHMSCNFIAFMHRRPDIFCQQQERIWRIWKKNWKNSSVTVWEKKRLRYQI